jgi:hypothetical protein
MRVADPLRDLARLGESRRIARERAEKGVSVVSDLFGYPSGPTDT